MSDHQNKVGAMTIRLDQFLKLTGLVGTGGQAKLVIQCGKISVNGEIETRRGRQLKIGDLVVWGNDEFEVGLSAAEESQINDRPSV